ncbi:MAG: molybdopterin-guanine dinucleotide biosynthesis protein B [Deltaproteobacteria bacterium]|nr:molybdopterin-guanine dinucleotide biosynthesis protein B [Deltaproteobacteria bacterium]MBW1848835.1 molybdopterin-guanine dinucleotide biosynthesis protein B [Deltaproteobacteria bacterium]MBW2180831.1 molybdopterin-guanine dinucleotide biosynthesis protein B [Deltaproteobacteria bacterium]
MTPIISIVGKSGSGKTTLIEKIIRELKQRGYRVGTIKHIFHKFEIDKKGKDSWRHMEAGADTVVVASRDKIAMFKADSCEDLDRLKIYFQDMDIVLTEGFKEDKKPKIEVFRSSVHKEPLCLGDGSLKAIVTDTKIDIDLPVFGLEDIKELADFITETFLPGG